MRAPSSGQTRVVAVTSLVLCRRGFCVAVGSCTIFLGNKLPRKMYVHPQSAYARPLRHFLHSRFGVVFAGGEQRPGVGVFS